MTRLDRRQLLTAGGSLLLAATTAHSAAATTKPSAPRRPRILPQSWIDAPTLPVWPGDAPGASDFKPQPLPPDSPPVFLRNVLKPDLHVFRPERANGHAVLVIPGGAYWFVSVANEGAELAERLTPMGITVFVLTYRLPGEGWKHRADVPLQDAQRAMRVIRSNASRFAIDADKVSVLGFSAGGHLAATLATSYADPAYARVDSADELSAQPLAVALIYPVITMDAKWTHEMSRKLLLGDQPSDAEIQRRSAERHVSAGTPPGFVVHAYDDEAVPVENSIRFVDAMRAAKRPVEAHFLQQGGHAFGVGIPGTSSDEWTPTFAKWLARTA
ncbi:alpha/beta hydrolase [Peristeroidobacter soli]|uniref:alpha/beta hydrolase n=1 Tax=Peristeroidobacter soli TaxID=2497877 RepID=UPI00101DD27E|nr:alpha/beta hydrolase [Peristeroidobacter soli]